MFIFGLTEKNRMFYVGAHWGNQDDGYVCSSRRMRNSYKRRPQDYTRRILEIVENKELLWEREYLWLQQIKIEELGVRYYNLHRTKYKSVEYTDEMRVKMASTKGKKQDPEVVKRRAESIKKTMSTPEKKVELSEQAKRRWEIPGQKEAHSAKMKEEWADEEKRKARIESLTEAQNRPEVKAETGRISRERWENEEYRKKQSESHTGIKYGPRSEEYIEKQSKAHLKLWETEEHRKKMSEAHLNSEKSQESSRKNIRKCHTPEAIARNKEVKAANREAKKNDPVYIAQQKEQARQRALRRWHPELFSSVE